MSLLAWYQFNNDSINKGIEDADLIMNANINPVFSNNGKTGKGLNTGAFYWNAETSQKILDHKELSYCFWWKNLSESSDKNLLFGTSDMASNGGRKFSLFRYPTKNDLHWNWQSDSDVESAASGSYKATTSGIITGILPDDEWTHICITYKSPEAWLYINGELKQKLCSNYHYHNNTFNYSTQVVWNSNSRIINDLRFYDHCLSTSEIKEISKGLILHYDLSSQFGINNLAKGTSNWSGEWVETGSGFEIIDNVCKISKSSVYPKYIMTEVSVNQKFTISVDVKADQDATYNWICDYLNSSKIGVTYKSLSIDFTNEWKRVKFQVTIPNYSSIKYIAFGPRTSDNSNSTYFKNLKIESGYVDGDSLWVPNEEDAEYKELLLNYEFDESGNSNNGIRTNINYILDSSVGEYSSVFNGTTSEIITENNLNDIFINNQEFTISCWIKVLEEVNEMKVISYCGTNSNYKQILVHLSNDSGKLGLSFYNSDFKTNYAMNSHLNEWTFIAFTYKNKVSKVYANGELVGEYNHNVILETVPSKLIIGQRLNRNYERFKGQMSDFRIYATALSAEDIKQLYESKARIDKSGNLYCNQFVEIDNERNLLDTDQYWISGKTTGSYTQEKVECSDSSTGFATKITCTEAGMGFYMSGHKVFNKTDLVHGKQYVVSLYAKSDNRTTINLNVECASQQSKGQFTIGNTYRRLFKVFTYSNTTQWTAFTSYGGWAVDENVYIHSIKVTEYNPTTHFKNNSVVETNSFIEIKSEEKCKIYKQDIQSNEIIEI